MRQTAALFAAIFMACIVTAAWGQTSKEEGILDKDISGLNENAGKPGGEKVIVERLEKQFKVNDATIKSLRDQKLGYGEITIVMAMAEKLPGGITSANIDKIMAMRQGTPTAGWGAIAKKLGLKLGPVVSSVEKTTKASRKDMEKLEHETRKGEKAERPERMERPEKMERPEMPMRK